MVNSGDVTPARARLMFDQAEPQLEELHPICRSDKWCPFM